MGIDYFPFNAKDWLLSMNVQAMNSDERGQYIHLLCHDWISDGIPNDVAMLSKMVGKDSVSDNVLAMFTVCEDGRLRNNRLAQTRETVRAKLSKYSDMGKMSVSKRQNQTKVKRRLNVGSTQVERRLNNEIEIEIESKEVKDISTLAPNETKKRVRSARLHTDDITFDYETGAYSNITDKDFELWKDAYPAVNMDVALNQSAAWLKANPTKRKKNYRRFITNWMSRKQERGGR